MENNTSIRIQYFRDLPDRIEMKGFTEVIEFRCPDNFKFNARNIRRITRSRLTGGWIDAYCRSCFGMNPANHPTRTFSIECPRYASFHGGRKFIDA